MRFTGLNHGVHEEDGDKKRFKILRVLCVLCGLILLGATQVKNPVQSKLVAEGSRFRHNTREHKEQECAVCHVRRDNKPTPVFAYHSACIDCHVKDFVSTKSALCSSCHTMPIKTAAVVQPFPGNLREFGLTGFSHKQHADPSKIKGEKIPTCKDCHGFAAKGIYADYPSHPECYSCHAHQTKGEKSACASCHVEKLRATNLDRTTLPAYTNYRFTHGSHIQKPSIAGSCEKCHRVIEPDTRERASDMFQIATTRGQRHTSGCFSCHNSKKETTCSKCHVKSPI